MLFAALHPVFAESLPVSTQILQWAQWWDLLHFFGNIHEQFVHKKKYLLFVRIYFVMFYKLVLTKNKLYKHSAVKIILQYIYSDQRPNTLASVCVCVYTLAVNTGCRDLRAASRLMFCAARSASSPSAKTSNRASSASPHATRFTSLDATLSSAFPISCTDEMR